MKTFKWTVPEFPMTEREKNPPHKKSGGNPGSGKLIGGIAFSLMSLLYFSTASGFIKGLRSYLWDSTEGSVVSSDLRAHETSGGGEVTYRAWVNGIQLERTDEVFEKWTGDTNTKYEKWEADYSEGSVVTIYFNESGDTSLGHWPTAYSYHFGLQGIGTLSLGLSLVFTGLKQIKKANKAEMATPRKPSD